MSGTSTAPASNGYGAAHEAFSESLGPEAGSVRLREIRRSGLDCFLRLGFPTTRVEDWKYTDVGPIARGEFRPAPAADLGEVAPDELIPHVVRGMGGPLLVFVNGRFARELSRPEGMQKGVAAGSVAEAVARGEETVERHLARYAPYEEDAFTALNTAFIRDGGIVHVPAGVRVPQPIQLLFLGTGTGADEPRLASPRNLLVLEEGAQATLVETYAGLGPTAYFTNAVTEVVLQEGASLEHYKVGVEGEGAFHVGTIQVRQGRSSTYRSHSVTLGGAIVRNNIRAWLGDERTETRLDGVYVARARQVVDNYTSVDHAMPHCHSYEFYKGIIGGRATGVFNGRIYVHPHAQKTDAKQQNMALLLTPDATINSKPQLEIFADDVKCTHGATVGFLDEKALFYLRSRGIPGEAARRILTFAFANEVISRVDVPALREHLERALMARLEDRAGECVQPDEAES